MPFQIGIVTSSSGAAVRDILQILKKGAPCVDVIIRSVRVQGEFASKEIALGIEDFNNFGQVDAIIVCRGGGSSEDLWSFNEEIVVRAIYNSKIPVISAVGHQINITLADLTADIFVETPSAAAKIIVDKKNILLKEIGELRYGLNFHISESISQLNNKIIALYHMLKSPLDRLSEKQQFLDELLSGLNNNMRHFIDINKERFKSWENRLHAFSPLAVLARGYSLSMLLPEGQIVKDAAKLKPGDKIKTVLNKGSFISLVEDILNEKGEDRDGGKR
jgi:exodeoxyribonuclease VII large subunit